MVSDRENMLQCPQREIKRRSGNAEFYILCADRNSVWKRLGTGLWQSSKEAWRPEGNDRVRRRKCQKVGPA